MISIGHIRQGYRAYIASRADGRTIGRFTTIEGARAAIVSCAPPRGSNVVAFPVGRITRIAPARQYGGCR